jgi:undecaprenyl-diphosphatase
LFQAVSRAGDGWIWLLLAIALPLVYGDLGRLLVERMAIVGAVGLGVYKVLKRGTARARPCAAHAGPRALVPALDLYSFPSGHTLHAVAFASLVGSELPLLLWILLPFAVLVALSRLVLGLHYPTDVVAGAALGFVLAQIP